MLPEPGQGWSYREFSVPAGAVVPRRGIVLFAVESNAFRAPPTWKAAGKTPSPAILYDLAGDGWILVTVMARVCLWKVLSRFVNYRWFFRTRPATGVRRSWR